MREKRGHGEYGAKTGRIKKNGSTVTRFHHWGGKKNPRILAQK